MKNYTVTVTKDDNNTFYACAEDIPGCHAWGRTETEARNNLEEVILMLEEELEENNI